VQLLLRGQVLLVGSGHNELSVVDEAAPVRIDRVEHVLHFLVAHNSAVVLKISNLDFFHAKFSITVRVESLEDLGKVVTLTLAHELRGDEREGSLLESNVAPEMAEVIERVHGESFINLKGGQLSDPGVLQGNFGRGALFGVVCEQGTDETLAVLGDSLPDAVIEGELSLTNLLHDVLV